MNTPPLVLSPSGPSNISPSTSGSATATSPDDASGDDSSFAGALKNASPNPATTPTSSKAADDDSSGSGMPVAGKHSPQAASTSQASKQSPQAASAPKAGKHSLQPAPAPQAGKHLPPQAVLVPPAAKQLPAPAVPVPQADLQAAMALQKTAGTAVSAVAPDAADDGDVVPGAVTGLPANAKQGTGAGAVANDVVVSAASVDDAGNPAGDTKDALPVGSPAGAAAGAASGKLGAAKLNTAFNNLLGMPATDAPDADGVPAAAVTAAPGGAAAGTAAGVTTVQTVDKGAAADVAPTIAASTASSTTSGIKSAAKTASPALRPQAAVGSGSSGVRAVGAVGADAGTDAASGSGAPVGSAQAATAAPGSPNDSSAIAAAAAASQAADPAGTSAGNASDAVVAGSGVAGPVAAAPATAVALAAAHAAESAAARLSTVQSAAALAAGNDDDKHAHATDDTSAPASTGSDAVASMFQLNPSTTGSTTATTGTPTFQLHQSLDSGDLAQGLSDRVTYMVNNGLNGAKLQVNPPQLGPIELRVAVSGGHAQVWMTTQSAVTRDALESSSSKLREMLGAQGFGQVSVDVSQRSFQDRSSQAQPYQRMAAVERGTSGTAAVSSISGVRARTSQGGLDAYA